MEIPLHHSALPGGINKDPKNTLVFYGTDRLPGQYPDTEKPQVSWDIPLKRC
jgi:hypothetical protein